MNISLTPELEELVQSYVASGQYNNASEVIREALRLLIQKDTMGRYYEEWLASQVEVGWQQAERSELEVHDMDDIVKGVLSETRV